MTTESAEPARQGAADELLAQLQKLLGDLERDLRAVKEERAELRREIAEIKGVLLGGAVNAGRPLKIRVEDNETKIGELAKSVAALEAQDTTSKSGLIWAGLAIAASSGITALVVWLLTRAGA